MKVQSLGRPQADDVADFLVEVAIVIFFALSFNPLFFMLAANLTTPDLSQLSVICAIHARVVPRHSVAPLRNDEPSVVSNLPVLLP